MRKKTKEKILEALSDKSKGRRIKIKATKECIDELNKINRKFGFGKSERKVGDEFEVFLK